MKDSGEGKRTAKREKHREKLTYRAGERTPLLQVTTSVPGAEVCEPPETHASVFVPPAFIRCCPPVQKGREGEREEKRELEERETERKIDIRGRGEDAIVASDDLSACSGSLRAFRDTRQIACTTVRQLPPSGAVTRGDIDAQVGDTVGRDCAGSGRGRALKPV